MNDDLLRLLSMTHGGGGHWGGPQRYLEALNSAMVRPDARGIAIGEAPMIGEGFMRAGPVAKWSSFFEDPYLTARFGDSAKLAAKYKIPHAPEGPSLLQSVIERFKAANPSPTGQYSLEAWNEFLRHLGLRQ